MAKRGVNDQVQVTMSPLAFPSQPRLPKTEINNDDCNETCDKDHSDRERIINIAVKQANKETIT